MRLALLTLLSLGTLLSCLAQVGYNSLGNSHELRINANGNLGIDLTTLKPASFLSGESEENAFFSQAGLWIVAESESGFYHTSVQYLSGLDSFDFWPGPIDTLTGQTGKLEDWNNTSAISQVQIDYHKANWERPNYQLADELKDWPAQGFDGFAKYLAPFVDYNQNQVYDPENGDYPAIKGEKAVYCIFNDLQNEHTVSFGPKIGLEVQLMAYTKENESGVFLEYFIINRSDIDYKNISVGFFISGECGNKLDNYCGTLESFPQSLFVYNADDYDEDHFEWEKPYILATFLNENLENSMAFTEGNLKNGQPLKNTDFINYSSGMWKDTTPLTFGQNGTSAGMPVSYIYSQSDENSTSFWDEEFSSNTAGNRTILGSRRYENFQSKDFIKLDICLDAGLVDSTSSIKEVIKAKAIHNSSIYKTLSKVPSFASEGPNIRINPNPCNGTFYISDIQHDSQISIVNEQGQNIAFESKKNKNTIRCNISEPSGIYWVRIKSVNRIIIKKLIITP